MQTLFKVKSYAEFARLRSTAAAPILTLSGYISAGVDLSPIRIAAAATSSLTMMAFAQAFNDIVDRDLDAANKPMRPLPSGRLSLSEGRWFVAALSISTISFGVLAGVATLVVALICLALAVVYSCVAKSTVLVGNAIVAAVAGATFVYGSISVHAITRTQTFAVAEVALFILGNELFKTGLDASGDSHRGLTTIATRYGLGVTGLVIMVCAGAISATFICMKMTGNITRNELCLALICAALPTCLSSILLIPVRSINLKRFRRSHVLWRAAWIPGVLVVLFLTAAK